MLQRSAKSAIFSCVHLQKKKHPNKKVTCIMLLRIRMFTRRGDHWSPLQTNFGRVIVFSADLCYNGANEKPRPLGEVAAKPTERAQLCAKNPLTRYRGSSPTGRAFGSVRLQGYGICPTRCNTNAKLAIKQNDK